RIRYQGGAVGAATYQALGAIPVVLDASESMVALTQHAVEGLDVNLDGFWTAKYYTIVRHVALSHHVFSVMPLMASSKKLEAMPAPVRSMIREEGRNAITFWRSSLAKQTATDIQLLKKDGVAFTDIDRASFRKAVEPVYAMFQPRLGTELLTRVS